MLFYLIILVRFPAFSSKNSLSLRSEPRQILGLSILGFGLLGATFIVPVLNIS